MKRVNWDGSPLRGEVCDLPADLNQSIFDYLPPPIAITPAIEDLADRYLNGQISGPDYLAMQAAAFLRPASHETHQMRRDTFRERAAEAESLGFVVPAVFRELVETDSYVDRLHHNTIWLQMPEEVWPLPSNPSSLVFLAFAEGQGCCHWHLLLLPDGSHSVICSGDPFGLPSNWPGHVPDYSQWEFELCAGSIEEWLYFYFLNSAEHDRQYLTHIRPYQ